MKLRLLYINTFKKFSAFFGMNRDFLFHFLRRCHDVHDGGVHIFIKNNCIFAKASLNKDDNIHKSKALKRYDRRILTLVECQN